MKKFVSLKIHQRLFSLFFALLLTALPAIALARPVQPNLFLAEAPASENFARYVRRLQTAQRALPPAQYIPPRNFNTRHIKLDLRFDWAREQAIGTETITLTPATNNIRDITLDATNMTFASVKLAATGAPLTFAYDPAREKLNVALDRPYKLGEEIVLLIEYRTNGRAVSRTGGAIGDAFGRGLTFNKPNEEEPDRPRQIYSQGESEFNHYWFPCFDHPNDFHTSEVIATVEKPFIVISNGSLIETRDNPDNTRTFHWRIDVPHAAYLTSIVVGEYSEIRGKYEDIPVLSYVYPNEVREGAVTVSRLPDMVRFFSEKTGVKYPYVKYAQTMVRDFGGGMENISATTMLDTMIHDARAEIDETSDSLESHELAHQWFGDFVTTRSWSDIWLNESFATYFQALWDEKSLGEDDFLFADVKANQDQYFAAWRQGLRRPIVTKNYRNPDDLFDAYAYQRGGAVLHMLRKTLGEDDWWRAIRHYLTKYAHQPVETAQLRIAIEEATGRPMDWFFDEWVYKMGHPVLNVTQSYDDAAKRLTLNVKQEQKIDASNPFPQVDYFQMPVEIEIATATARRIERVQMEAKPEQTFTFSVDSKPLLVNFDYHGTLIKELKFDKTADELLYQASKDSDMLGRLSALDQLGQLLKASATSDADKARITAALASSVTSDLFWGVRREAAALLDGTTDPAARQSLLTAAARDTKSLVRARAIQSLGDTRDAALAGLYQQSLNDQSYAVVRAAAIALGKSKSPAAYDALVKLLDVPSWRESVRVSALTGLAALDDPRAFQLAMNYTKPGTPVPLRVAAYNLLATVGKKDALTYPLISDALVRAAAAGSQALTYGAAQALVRLGDPRALKAFEEARKRATFSIPEELVQQFEQALRASQQTDAAKPSP
jgi:aminopeptidase N